MSLLIAWPCMPRKPKKENCGDIKKRWTFRRCSKCGRVNPLGSFRACARGKSWRDIYYGERWSVLDALGRVGIWCSTRSSTCPPKNCFRRLSLTSPDWYILPTPYQLIYSRVESLSSAKIQFFASSCHGVRSVIHRVSLSLRFRDIC